MTEVRGIMSAQRAHCSLPPSLRPSAPFLRTCFTFLWCGATAWWPACGVTAGQVKRAGLIPRETFLSALWEEAVKQTTR